MGEVRAAAARAAAMEEGARAAARVAAWKVHTCIRKTRHRLAEVETAMGAARATDGNRPCLHSDGKAAHR